jgi:hypothetical protein
MQKQTCCSGGFGKKADLGAVILGIIINDFLGFTFPAFLNFFVMMLVLARLRQFIRAHNDNLQLVKVMHKP